MHKSMLELKKAIPYIRLYKGKVFVVKTGGRVLEKRSTLEAFTEDITLLHQLGIRVVLVHGGGTQATTLSERLGITPRMVNGRRVTSAETLEVAKMVYGGTINIDILSALRAHKTQAIGISGVDGALIRAKKRPIVKMAAAPGGEIEEIDFGHVGDIESVNTKFLDHLLDGDSVPVISSLGADDDGNVLNINADSIAEALASAMRAEKLLFLTDTDGILRQVGDPTSLVSYTDIEGIENLKAEGAIAGGMLPKVDACVRALKAGVKRTHIINGTAPNALLIEAFTNAGCGTMIVDSLEEASYRQAELER